MGNDEFYLECPNCKSENFQIDYYYKRAEIYCCCPDCRFYYDISFKRDKEDNLIRKDETKGFTIDNLILLKECGLGQLD